jgi:hypothetical protein
VFETPNRLFDTCGPGMSALFVSAGAPRTSVPG